MFASQPTPCTQPSDILSWQQIRERHPDCYVVLTDIRRAEGSRFDDFHARVLTTHTHRRDATAAIKDALKLYGSVACKWTGQLRLPTKVGLHRVHRL